MKTEQLQIRVSKEQKDAIKKRARLANQAMSEWILKQIFPDLCNDFRDLVGALSGQGKESRSFAFAAINDFLSQLDSRELGEATKDIEGIELKEFELNYLAAMVEFACHKKKVRAPDWVLNTHGLSSPHFGTSLQSLRLYLLRNSPIPFRKRNIYIDSSVGERV